MFPTSTFLRSFLTTSLHLFRGPHLGRGCGSQLNSITFGSLWSGILTKWPKHSSLLFCTFSLTVSASPHLLLTSAKVMRSDHCCLLEMPKMVLIHLWWTVFSCFSCRLSGVQHFAPYRRTERTHALYTLFLVASFRSLSRKTAFLSAPKAIDARATLLFTSASILPELSTKDPKYGNSSTASISSPSSTMGARSSSSTSLPVTCVWFWGC